MRHIHITRDLLRAQAATDGSLKPSVRQLLAHLLELCPTCRSELRAYYAETMGQTQPDLRQEDTAPLAEDGYDAAFTRATRAAARKVPSIDAERKAAAVSLAHLLALPPTRRRECITEAPAQFRGLALAGLLLETSLGQMPGKPTEALALARLAKAVLSNSELSNLATEFYARASAHVGNAFRVLGQLSAASGQFDDARFLLSHQPVIDPLVGAEMDRMEGSLRRDQRQFDRAEQLLQRAASSYQDTDQPREEALVLLKLGSLYREQGKPDQGVTLAKRVLAMHDPAQEPHLCLYAGHNLADALCDCGLHAQAREALAKNRSLQDEYGDPLSLLRLQWVEGKIAHGLGEHHEAEILFLLARHGFKQHEIACDAALVSLDLAVLYLEQQRTADVKALAAEMVVIFEGQEIYREAATALHLFRDAAELDQVSLALVRNLATYLVHASRDPTFAYQADS